MSMTVAREGGRQGMLLGHAHLFRLSDFSWRRQNPKKTSNGKQKRESKAFVVFLSEV